MPIKIPDGLPASKILRSENIFVMTEERALHQDIRPLRLLILNLMPKKVETETQLLRLLGNTPLQVEITLMQMASHVSKNTSAEHLLTFYTTFDKIKGNRYDGLIITGAPVELMDFEEVDYWPELCEIMQWSQTNVYSTLYICWAAQAGLYYHYGIPKYPLEKKLSGIYRHRVDIPHHPLMRGFDDFFYAPHSRHTETRREDVEKISGLDILCSSEEAGVYIAADHACRKFFVTGHSEYDRGTLDAEYRRDIGKGVGAEIPSNYYPGDDPERLPEVLWRSHASLLYSNWINFIVYQRTPYDLSEL